MIFRKHLSNHKFPTTFGVSHHVKRGRQIDSIGNFMEEIYFIIRCDLHSMENNFVRISFKTNLSVIDLCYFCWRIFTHFLLNIRLQVKVCWFCLVFILNSQKHISLCHFQIMEKNVVVFDGLWFQVVRCRLGNCWFRKCYLHISITHFHVEVEEFLFFSMCFEGHFRIRL